MSRLAARPARWRARPMPGACVALRATLMAVLALVVLLMTPSSAQDPILGHCKMCILVMETLRSGYPFSLPTICQDNLGLEKNVADFSICQQIMAVLSQYGPSVALWAQQGCFRTEEYGAVEQMTPCPPHVICSQMETLDAFVLASTDLSADPSYDHNKLGPTLIRPVAPQTQRRTDLIRTFCPQPKPQCVVLLGPLSAITPTTHTVVVVVVVLLLPPARLSSTSRREAAATHTFVQSVVLLAVKQGGARFGFMPTRMNE